ncbi:dr1-associated corepressor-like isoform X2 [Limulus polyphemus]|uniref:Dr1-associated corepressor-like isoform X2 n=2 Tax=Limulus polyphemus TaxID=6850 RepID=A0ABM1BQF1_LIMPO|nr:dr1-associated corepressor-like isoform X2 [Limulus polyphemus]
MPSKKKKYNARFPPARIKKIMQTDEEVGKVAAAVPVIISRALELFVESLIKRTSDITRSRNAKTLTTSHLKACIMADSQLHFLKDLVASVPDVQMEEEMATTGGIEPQQTGPCAVGRSRGRQRHRTGGDGSAGPSQSTAEDSETASDEELMNNEEDSEEASDENTFNNQRMMPHHWKLTSNPPEYYMVNNLHPAVAPPPPTIPVIEPTYNTNTSTEEDDYDS